MGGYILDLFNPKPGRIAFKGSKFHSKPLKSIKNAYIRNQVQPV